MVTKCSHPVLLDNPEQPGVNIYWCGKCGATVKVNELETSRAAHEPPAAPIFEYEKFAKDFAPVATQVGEAYACGYGDGSAKYASREDEFRARAAQPPGADDERAAEIIYNLRDALRYRRLRVLGCAPYGTDVLALGLVMRFTNLDELIDADIKAQPSRGEYSTATKGASR